MIGRLLRAAFVLILSCIIKIEKKKQRIRILPKIIDIVLSPIFMMFFFFPFINFLFFIFYIHVYALIFCFSIILQLYIFFIKTHYLFIPHLVDYAKQG